MIERPALRATPFHARTADANRGNAWLTRNGITLAAACDDTNAEALAARLNVAIGDISWRWRVVIEGARAAEFLARFVTRDVTSLVPGMSMKALWLADGGGVRGAGIVARLGPERFQLVAAAPDGDWLLAAAQSYSIGVRDISAEAGGLAVIGPHARETLATAGLMADIGPLSFRRSSWRGIDVTLSCWGEQGGFEIWCEPDDGVLVWDRLMEAGERFGIAPAGALALDVLDLEAGIARPDLDYTPARDGDAAHPTPRLLGLESLIDVRHAGFNGRAGFLAARGGETRTLVGIEIHSETPAPFAPLLRNGVIAGHSLRSVYSPALRRAIALAFVDATASAPGTMLSLTLPPSFASPTLKPAIARVSGLPFLASPGA
jgi:aminomethyltransferase